mmetsp:Transcript_1463/g.2220  ORF Transcript_1463/g.2220 Transcript_1463/m.2220 type:complete len:149 (+) Transcript_1463:49-495(+)|eukprot:CAMPEP_0117424830 /NCGR_PEP_ID=MMETSP0758-20121206/5188_1 /TAXON_ID=63605 /ORGANISM="Percolomonas cosmopolitus, Strain AE-1 (ATCC 50343)" /LENGTH=148 /DNA_ID=CAMNT_0005208879 /DNA_START=30 /DNA_END=476 /DNA_ORIENTATION=-
MVNKAATLKDVSSQRFINAFASLLKKKGEIELPKWVDIVKTAHKNDLPPLDPDWFYTRCASVLRAIYLRPGTGVGALRRKYGGKKNRGVKPERKIKSGLAAGSPIRVALQRLETIGYVEQDQNGGRRITQKGQKACDEIAVQLLNNQL